MTVFKKKTTLVHHITYMGIMTAINLIFIVLATYVPFLMFSLNNVLVLVLGLLLVPAFERQSGDQDVGVVYPNRNVECHRGECHKIDRSA